MGAGGGGGKNDALTSCCSSILVDLFMHTESDVHIRVLELVTADRSPLSLVRVSTLYRGALKQTA